MVGQSTMMKKESVLAPSQRYWAKVKHCHQSPTSYFWSEQSKKQICNQSLLDILKRESKPLYNPQSFAQTLLEYKQTVKINLTQELTNLLQTLHIYPQSCKQTSCNVCKP
jgi:hypothetical protein